MIHAAPCGGALGNFRFRVLSRIGLSCDCQGPAMSALIKKRNYTAVRILAFIGGETSIS